MTAIEPAALRRAPLQELAGELRAASGDEMCIEPLGFRSLVNLRGQAADADFTAAVGKALGIELPLDANRWIGDEHRAAIWLGPDEWLIVAPDGEAGSLEDAIRTSRDSDPWLSVVDVSHNYTSLMLSGPGVRELLAKGCSLDLHPRAIGHGDCVQTVLAKARVLLRIVENGSIELTVRNSFAPYTARWLIDAL